MVREEGTGCVEISELVFVHWLKSKVVLSKAERPLENGMNGSGCCITITAVTLT